MNSSIQRWGIPAVLFATSVYMVAPTTIDMASGHLDGTPGITSGPASHFIDVRDRSIDDTDAEFLDRFEPRLSSYFQQNGGVVFQYRVDVDSVSGDEDTRGEIIDETASIVDARLAADEYVVERIDDTLFVAISDVDKREAEFWREVIEQVGDFRFSPVDDQNTDEFFAQFRGNLPEGFQLRLVEGGYHSVTHADRDALREFFADRTPEDREIGFSFHAVADENDPDTIDEDASYWISMLLKDETVVSHEQLQSASVKIDEDFYQPYVALEFDDRGTEAFADFTVRYVGLRFAIVLDDEVLSAPVINEPITEGRAQVRLGHHLTHQQQKNEAQSLVSKLETAPLPASITADSTATYDPKATVESSGLRASIGFGLLLFCLLFVLYGRSPDDR